MNRLAKRLSILLLLVITGTCLHAQKAKAKKYPSLFWEITGNGLKKPSYLFGTMHVSSKMVFHLSDSFYHAIRNCDAVALELNPELWQKQMFRMQRAQLNLSKFAAAGLQDYLNEKSFQLEKYEDQLKSALSEEPMVVNSLLYRNYQSRADFEENTYLDLYIYQTGRKMGKMAAGVEDYMETERLMLEAYEDMAKEKKRKQADTDAESMIGIQTKLQEAYRKGDLDLMDSLEKITNTSPAFNEKFLYRRNEIQAHSIDTILHRRSLFVGVGAAHLPGERGVIELLRKKGYKLRPIIIADRDADQKERIDKLHVPVEFVNTTSDDGMVQVQVPGNLFKREEGGLSDSWQYSDMNNGSYYMLTRVHTRAATIGHSKKSVLAMIDSLLYEYVPGKIIKKTVIANNGYDGYDIVNKTRRGDLQRYNIFVTPFEVYVFKMSGNDDYVSGKEGETFFGSIRLKPATGGGWQKFEPAHGGFSVDFPQLPTQTLNNKTPDRTSRWEYEAVDEKTGDAYMLWKKSIHNFSFIEEDTFDLSLVEESFKKSELVDKQLSRKFGNSKGVPYLDMQFSLKNGQYARAKAFIKGTHYYLLAATGKNRTAAYPGFFDSFNFTNYHYAGATHFRDTSLNLDVYSAVKPDLDTALHSWMNRATSEEVLNANEENYSYWPRSRNAVFQSDSTGETVFVSVETFPKYYYSRDSARFWREKINEKEIEKDLIIRSKERIFSGDSIAGYKIVLGDTNSSRQIRLNLVLKDNRFYRFINISDTTNVESDFVKGFFATAQPLAGKRGPSVFDNKTALFFADYASSDTLTRKHATKSVNEVFFGKAGLDRIIKAIHDLRYGDKDYFLLKSSFIAELGYIDDSCCIEKVTKTLRDLYEQAGDTTYFQNPILTALARLKTRQSYAVLKELLVQDPPVFEDSYEYSGIFDEFSDTLALSRALFPEMLQLASVDDYKDRVNGLLRELVDSSIFKSTDYSPYFSKLYFDAKIQLKKLQSKEGKILEKESKQDDQESTKNEDYEVEAEGRSLISDYAVSLMPYYDSVASVPKFFDKLLLSKDRYVRLETIILMLRNGRQVHDSIIESLASTDQYRAKLLAELEKIKKTSRFPAIYTQVDIARSLLLNDKGLEKFAAIELVNKQLVETKMGRGYVYLFKYRKNKNDEWQIGISGLQPLNQKQISSNHVLVSMTGKKLRADEPSAEQFQKQLKRLVYSMHKSSMRFFNERDYAGNYDDYSSED